MKQLVAALLMLTIIIATVVAIDERNKNNLNTENSDPNNKEIEETDNDNDLSTDLTFEPRKLVHHALLGFGGLHALAVLFAIKLKIVIIAAIIGAAILYYIKFIAVKKSCELSKIYDEPPMSFEHGFPSGYSNHMPSGDLTSYNGPDPYSAYSDIHPDISGHDFHSSHHSSEITFDDPTHSSPGDVHGRHAAALMHGGGGGSFQSQSFSISSHPESADDSEQSIGASQDAVNSDGTINTEQLPQGQLPQRRYARDVRQFYNQNQNPNIGVNTNFNLNLGEIIFTFLGVDSDGCRRRFVCELDFRARRSPLTRLAYMLIGSQFFDHYRNLTDSTEIPKRFSDCARIFNECSAAAAYDNANNDNSNSNNNNNNENNNDNNNENNVDDDDDDDQDDHDEENVDEIENSVNTENSEDIASVTDNINNEIIDNEARSLFSLNTNVNGNDKTIGKLILNRSSSLSA